MFLVDLIFECFCDNKVSCCYPWIAIVSTKIEGRGETKLHSNRWRNCLRLRTFKIWAEGACHFN